MTSRHLRPAFTSLALALTALAAASAQQRATIPVPAPIQAAYANKTRDPKGAPGPKYWQIWPEYDLTARLDPASALVHGSGMLSFVNSSSTALQEIVLRLDQNRFRAGVSNDVVTRGINLRELAINGRTINLAGSAIAGLNTTVVRVKLDRPIAAGERVLVRAAWDYEVPRDEDRLALRQGRWGNEVFQIAQWYPRLAMFDDLGGWDTTAHDGSVEFFNPFARFRVTLQAPAGWLVGATGTLKNAAAVLDPAARQRLETVNTRDATIVITESKPAGTGTHQNWIFEADSVRDFAWGTAANYAWIAASKTGSHGRYIVHALTTPRNRQQMSSATAGALDALIALSDQLVPYASRSHTLLDGPEGGMEYPALTMTNGDDRLSHEIAHQWFPMMVGSDETRFDFLDEGFASFLVSIIQNDPPGELRTEPKIREPLQPLLSPTDIRTKRFVIGYGRGDRMLHTLAARFGRDRVVAALRAYALAWRFKHPSPWDFMASMETALGQDLDAFWMQWLFSAAEIPPPR